MPSFRSRCRHDGDGEKTALSQQTGQVDHAGPVAEPVIGFLQSNDVGADVGDDRRYPIRIEAFVGADAFVDIVGGDWHARLRRGTRGGPPVHLPPQSRKLVRAGSPIEFLV